MLVILDKTCITDSMSFSSKWPALREHPSDIPLLANLLMAKLCANLKAPIPQMDDAAQSYITKLPFPGNVRELENMLERALAMCDGKMITTEDLLHEGAPTPDQTPPDTALFTADTIANVSLPDYLEEIEKNAIMSALTKTNNNKTAAAKLLGVSFRTLRYRLSKLGLTKEEDMDNEIEDEARSESL